VGQLAPRLVQASTLPALIVSADDHAQLRFLEFFAANIRNPNIRRAYARACSEFLAWCDVRGVPSIVAGQPIHVAGKLTRERSAPTAKQHLAAIRHLFDWLLIGQVGPVHTVASVCSPAHSVRRDKTPVLAPEEAGVLLDSINVATHANLRDRALIAPMLFSFARFGAAVQMRVEDGFVQQRQLWVRLHEKGGERHEIPCHHAVEDYLHVYIDGCGLGDEAKGPLFCTIARGTGRLSAIPLPQANAFQMVRRRGRAAGIATAIGIIRSERPESPPISRTVARSKRLLLWRTMHRRARLSSMTGGPTRSPSMRWKKCQFNNKWNVFLAGGWNVWGEA
jgi:integrase/recombinase XerC